MQRRIINTSNKPTTSPIKRSSVIMLPRPNTPTTNSLSGPSRIIPHPIVISSTRPNTPINNIIQLTVIICTCSTVCPTNSIVRGRPGVFVQLHPSINSEEEEGNPEDEEFINY